MRVLKKLVYGFELPMLVLLTILTLFGRQWIFVTFPLLKPLCWLTHPNKIDTVYLVPVGMNTSGDVENKEVDVFFVHSTGFVGPGGWNYTM
jgi:hypothetical protein